ncbi:HAD family hydrolase [Pedobacter polysacchareus]|uniref:HAD family hydrolase n=1 Tax=Pedobacter polysacchareus TaxID=2861973 RepID=UPI001C99A380|nr:HAD-IA family hydrolase [Pedobacter polysacchareus]
MKDSRIKVLFFDVGGVLLNNGWGHQSRQEAAKLFDLNYEEMDVLHDFIFNVYEIGKITLDDYLDVVVFNHPRSFSKQDFKDFMFAQSVELPGLLSWLKEWKKTCGHRLISINNEGRELNNYRIQKFGLHDCFDAFISSCEVGMRKPDPGIFNLAMGIAQVSPEECIYFDDRLMLIKTAQKLGIRSFHHQDFATTQQIIQEINSSKNP